MPLAATEIRGKKIDAAASRHPRRLIMAKYLVGWLLGVPAVVLVILYLFFH